MARLDQQALLEIFHAVRKEMLPYEKGSIRAKIDIEGKYDLWSEKKVVILGRERDEMNFVTLILQSSYVGFYYMPIYTNNEALRAQLGEDLLKTLKGKACFHLKSADKELMKQVKNAMKVGYEAYKKNGWI